MASMYHNFPFFLSFLLYTALAQSLSGPSLKYLNISATSAYSSGLPGSITSAPLSSGTAKKCPLCQVNWLGGGGPEPVRFYWYNSTLGVTLDTVSIIVTQYNNTAIPRTTTVHGDVNSLNISTITTAIDIARTFAGTNNEYEGPPVVLASGTDGSLFHGKSIPYPTAYVEFDSFAYTTVTKQSPNCPAGQQEVSGRCECALTNWFPPGQLDSIETSAVTLQNAYYTVLDSGMGMNGNGNFFGFDNVSLSEWIVSDTALMSTMPQLSTCFYVPEAHGPPGVKIPVSALTATSTTTVKESGQYNSNTALPANSLTNSVPAPTSEVPVGSEILSAPSSSPTVPNETTPQSSINTLPGTIPAPSLITQKDPVIKVALPSDKLSPTPAVGLPDPPNPPRPSAGSPIPALQSDNPDTPKNPKSSHSDPEPKQQNLPGSAKQTNPIPIIILGGSTVSADLSSYYALPSIGILEPGGSDVTTNNVVYSLAPSAAAIISNGNLISLDHVEQSTYVQSEPTPILSLGTALYTADSSSQFIISGQTVKPGGPAITVAGTPISLDAAGSVAVIGTSVQPLITPAPSQNAPVLTFAGSTFTANSASKFVVAGQTLTQGSQITVSGVPISLDLGGTVAIIGTSTQNLIHDQGPEITKASAPPPVYETPFLTFAGSTFTANSASQFVIAGQTLTQEGQITVSGVPISLKSGGTVAIIGTSTENLIHGYGPEITQFPAPLTQERPILTFGKSTLTANEASHFVIADQTLTQGGQITVSGTRISLAQNGKTALIGTSTQPLIHDHTPTLTRATVFTLGATPYTADDVSSHFIIEGQTLLPGGVLTVAGTRVSYPPTGSDIIVGTSPEAIHLGSLILQGLGGATQAAGTAVSTPGLDRPGNGSTTGLHAATGGVEGFTGAAPRALEPGIWRSLGAVGAGLVLGLWLS